MEYDICPLCGKCCRQRLEIFNDEYERILPYLPSPRRKINEYFYLLSNGKKDCPALSSTGCIIPYDLRPAICKMYPYTISDAKITDTGLDITFGLSKKCPYWAIFPNIPENTGEMRACTDELLSLTKKIKIKDLKHGKKRQRH